ncbi:MAG: chromosomal replication initiator protein DnaA [Pseudomonadota bacterium]
MQDILNKIKLSLHQKVRHNTYMLWFEPLTFNLEREEELIISCPDFYTQKWIAANYINLIKQEAEQYLGKGVRLDLITKEGGDVKYAGETEKLQLALPTVNQNHHQQQGQEQRRIFRPDFTFDKFVVGTSNDFAYNAVLTLGSHKNIGGVNNNILFLLAQTGLGKSHLAHSLGNHIATSVPNQRVWYITAEDFTNELIASLKKGTMEQFKKKYRTQCDLLVLENIHFLSGKQKIQEELCFTLDALFDSQKKVMFTSSYSLDEIPKLNANLKSRLAYGIVSSINLPDYQTRVRIITKKLEDQSARFTEDVVNFVAESLTDDIRQIESAIVGMLAKSSLLNIPIDTSLAESVVRDISKKCRKITLEEVQGLICKFYKISLDDLISKSRKQAVTRPRHIAMYLCRKFTSLPLEAIGKAFNRYHATTLHAISNIENIIKRKGPVASEIAFLTEKLEKKIETT